MAKLSDVLLGYNGNNSLVLPILFASILAPTCMTAGQVEAGVFANKQFGSTLHLGAGYNGADNTQDAVKPNGYGISFAYLFTPLVLNGTVAVTGSFQPASSSDFIQSLAPNPPQTFGTYKVDAFAAGARLGWGKDIEFQAGVEVRREHLEAGALGSSTSLTRPWASIGLCCNVDLKPVAPFVQLEAAAALVNKTLSAAWDQEDLLKAMSPRYEIRLTVGGRF